MFRGPRWRNDNVDYSSLKPFERKIVYFGPDDEFRDGLRQTGMFYARHFHGSVIDICNAFKRVAFVVGLQTFLFSLAEALKVPRLCEMSSSIPDVIPRGGIANDFVDENDLANCLRMYSALLK